MTRRQLWNTIFEVANRRYEAREARAITSLLCERLFAMRFTDVVIEPEAPCPEGRGALLERVVRELAQDRPVQYIIGYTLFADLRLVVREGVLIPRPETEELVAWMCASLPADESLRIWDLGTGSGAIALALAARLPRAEVTGMDVSAEALAIARENARLNHLKVHFVQADLLRDPLPGALDVIVSNPPYVTRSEAAQMAENVLRYEPHRALFVENDDPLLFYRTIAERGTESLRPGGWLYVEINERFGAETLRLLAEQGYDDRELRNDMFGKPRMIRARYRGEKKVE